jgi:putative transposase
VHEVSAHASSTNIARLTNEWETEYRAFQKRDLADRDYVYVWVDGVHFNVRLEDDRLQQEGKAGRTKARAA